MPKSLYLMLLFILSISYSCKKDKTDKNISYYHIANFVCNDALLDADGESILMIGNTTISGADLDMGLVKINKSSGNILWNKHYGFSYTEKGIRIQATADGYLIAGVSNNAIGQPFDILLLKVDKDGNQLWLKTYGGSADEAVANVAIKSNGNIVIAATTKSMGAGDRDVLFYELDATGNILQEKTFGGSGLDGATDMIYDANIFYTMAYTTSIGHGDRDIWLMALDENLDTLWTKTIGTNLYEESSSITMSNDHQLLLCGHSGTFPMHSGFLAKYALDGSMVFEKMYGGADHDGFQYAQQLKDNSIKSIGYSSSFGNAEQAYIITTDQNGTLSKEENFGDANNQRLHKLLEDDTNIYFLGEDNLTDCFFQKLKK